MRNFWLLVSVLWLWTCSGGGGSSPTEPQEPAPVSNFTASPTTLIQGQAVTFTSTSTGTITSYAWNVDNDPAIEGTTATYSHTYTEVGTYSVTLTVTGPGGSNPKTVADMITVSTAAPTPTTATSQTVQEDGSTTISLTATDPNGQAVTFAITTDPTNGTATLSGTDITYTPNANFYGSDSFDYTASNGTYTSDPVTITITVEGEDDGNPTTNDVSATTDEDTVVTVNLDATEIDGDNYSFSIVSQPSNGTLGSVNGNQVEYTPTQDWNGTDTFTFEATDDRTSRRNIATATITVNAVNDAPVANDVTASMDENKIVGRYQPVTITLDATDVEGDALTYFKQSDPTNGTLGSFTNNQVVYTPTQDFNGEDTFIYKATDGSADSNGATVTITIASVNDAPISSDVSASTNEDTSVSVALDVTDVDGDALTSSILSAASNGTTTISGNVVNYTPSLNFNGTDTFTYIANDGVLNSNISTATITVNAVNDAPVASDISAATNEDTAVDVTLSATDVEGDALTFLKVSDPTNGTVTINGTTASYTPVLDFNGTDTFTYKANDGNSDSNTVTVTITVAAVNDAPVANDVTTSMDEEKVSGRYQPLTIALDATDIDGDNLAYSIITNTSNGVLGTLNGNQVVYTPSANFNGTDTFTYKANDGSLDSNTATVTITISAVNDAPVTVDLSFTFNEDDTSGINITGASDIEGDALTYSVVTNPSNGSLTTVTNDGKNLNYTPSANFNGTDTFTYKANDGELDSNISTITLNISAVNDAPIANDVSVSMDEERVGLLRLQPVTITLDATDVDNQTLSYAIVSNASNGTLGTINGNQVVYTPSANFNGTDTFTYKANDGELDSNTATVTITVAAVNDAPVASDLSAATNEDTAVDVTLSATDVEGDALTFLKVSDPTNGTVTINGTTASYTPVLDFNGTDTFTYKANDGNSDSNTATVTITVAAVNDAPVANDASATTNEDTAVDVTLSVTDVEDDTLGFSLVTNPSNGTASISGNILSYTPNDEWGGIDTFTYKANDGELDSNTATITITVNGVNDNAPTVGNITQTIDEDITLTVVLTASDVDGDAQTFSLASNPLNGTATISNDTLTYVPNQNFNGLDLFKYKSNDGAFDSNEGNVTITINAVNDAPTISIVGGSSSITVVNDNEKTFEVNVSDIDSDISALSLSSSIPSEFKGETMYNWLSHNSSGGEDATTKWNFKAEYNSTSGNFDVTYRPPLNTLGTFDLTLIASDGSLESSFDLETIVNGMKISTPGSDAGETWVAKYGDTYTFSFEISAGFIQQGANFRSVWENGTSNQNSPPVPSHTWTSSTTGTVTVKIGSEWKYNPTWASGQNLHPNIGGYTPGEGYWYDAQLTDPIYREVWYFDTIGNGGPLDYNYRAHSPLFEVRTGIIATPIRYDRWGVPKGNRDKLFRGSPYRMVTYGGDKYRLYKDGSQVTELDRSSERRVVVDYPEKDEYGNIQIVQREMYESTTFIPLNIAAGSGYEIRGTNSANNIIYDKTPEFDIVEMGISNSPAGSTVTIGDTLYFEFEGNFEDRFNDHSFVVNLMKGIKPDDASMPTDGDALVIMKSKLINASYYALKKGDTYTWRMEKNDGNGNSRQVDTTVGGTGGTDYLNEGKIPFHFKQHPDFDELQDGDDYYIYVGSIKGWKSGEIYIDNQWQGGYPQDLWWSDYFSIDDGVNDPPTGENATASTNEDTAVDITLVGTDGDTNDSTLTYSLISTPTNGTATIGANVVTYTPNDNWNGTDSMSYQVSDGNSSSSTYIITVTVNAVNDAPVASNDAVTVSTGGASQITLTASDVDGDTLTYSIVTDSAVGGTTSITGSTLLYLPPSGFTGVDQITFKANDGTVDSNTATVTITVQ